MASDIRQPADDSRLHDDPADLARWHEAKANAAFDACHGATPAVRERMIAKWENHSEVARKYRRLAARGETVPKF